MPTIVRLYFSILKCLLVYQIVALGCGFLLQDLLALESPLVFWFGVGLAAILYSQFLGLALELGVAMLLHFAHLFRIWSLFAIMQLLAINILKHQEDKDREENSSPNLKKLLLEVVGMIVSFCAFGFYAIHTVSPEVSYILFLIGFISGMMLRHREMCKLLREFLGALRHKHGKDIEDLFR